MVTVCPLRATGNCSMHHRLFEILKEKEHEVETLKKRGISINGIGDMPPIRDFKSAISPPHKIGLIAEIKFSSPSSGVIREKQDPLAIGRIYEEAGAAAISLLTDRPFFGGELQYLPQLKRVISLPILRKDFIIDEVQVKESFLFGADAILLICRTLSYEKLKALFDTSKEVGMAVLVEVHDEHDLENALKCGADIIGINNRNLDTFEVDFNTTMKLAPLVPDTHITVSESGISTPRDIFMAREVGVQAVLVGSALMGSNNVALRTRELVHAGDSKFEYRNSLAIK